MSGTTAAKRVSISAEASAAPGRGPAWDRQRRRRCLGNRSAKVHRRQHEVAVFVAQLLVPVFGVACSAESVHGDAGESEPVGASPDSDAVDRAHDLADTVGGPRARFGNDECPVGGKEAVDGEEPQRGRTVDDDQLVRHPLEGHRQAVVRPIGSMRSWDSRKASAGVAATTDGGRTESGSVGQPLVSRSPAIEPPAPRRGRGRRRTVVPRLPTRWWRCPGGQGRSRGCRHRDQALAASPSAIVVLPTPPFG